MTERVIVEEERQLKLIMSMVVLLFSVLVAWRTILNMCCRCIAELSKLVATLFFRQIKVLKEYEEHLIQNHFSSAVFLSYICWLTPSRLFPRFFVSFCVFSCWVFLVFFSCWVTWVFSFRLFSNICLLRTCCSFHVFRVRFYSWRVCLNLHSSDRKKKDDSPLQRSSFSTKTSRFFSHPFFVSPHTVIDIRRLKNRTGKSKTRNFFPIQLSHGKKKKIALNFPKKRKRIAVSKPWTLYPHAATCPVGTSTPRNL